MIGVDPHKGSHPAVVISPGEEPLGEIRIRACAAQAGNLVAWAADWAERTWAVEGAAGLGRLLVQQLVAVGERVLDVQPKLAARVRLLQAGDANKNDLNDAWSVAVAALRSRTARQVTRLKGLGSSYGRVLAPHKKTVLVLHPNLILARRPDQRSGYATVLAQAITSSGYSSRSQTS